VLDPLIQVVYLIPVEMEPWAAAESERGSGRSGREDLGADPEEACAAKGNPSTYGNFGQARASHVYGKEKAIKVVSQNT
jgi:hypothetical protein